MHTLDTGEMFVIIKIYHVTASLQSTSLLYFISDLTTNLRNVIIPIF